MHATHQLGLMRERLEVIRAFLVLAWQLKALSHHDMADLNARLDGLGRQATRWQQWFKQLPCGKKA